RLLDVVGGNGVVIQRVVLALAGGDDAIAEGGGELDQLHAGRGLVAGADGVDDAEPVGLRLEIGPNGDVGLDIHHHQVLAVLHGEQVVVGGDARLAGGVDDHVDLGSGDQRLGRGDGDLARLDGGAGGGGAVGQPAHGIVAIGDGHGLERRMRA